MHYFPDKLYLLHVSRSLSGGCEVVIHTPRPENVDRRVGTIFAAVIAATSAACMKRQAFFCQEEDHVVKTSDGVLRFGAIADIQYADVEDRRGRRYRATLPIVERAVNYFNKDPDLQFVLHGGDIVDFYNTEGAFASDGGSATASALAEVMSRMDKLNCPERVSLVGNHELYNWSREALLKGVEWEMPGQGRGILRFCPEGSRNFWHTFSPCQGWTCVVLDPYDISIYRKGRNAKPAPFSYDLDREALAELCRRNANVARFVKEHPGENVLCNYFDGISPGVESRWVPFNGAVGEQQLEWLKGKLEECAQQNNRVIIFSHVLVHPHSSFRGMTLLWNYAEVLEIIQSRAGRSVQVVMSGHQHQGGFYTDEFGIHYIVMESPLESRPGWPGPFMIVQAGEAFLDLKGFGNAKSPVFPEAASQTSEHGEGPMGHRRLPLRSAAAGSTSSSL